MAKQSGERAAKIPSWSWPAAAVGFVLVAGSAGFMLYQALTGDPSPPNLVIEAEAVVPNGRIYVVPIRVANSGGSAAAGLTVEGILKEGTATVETSAVTVDYVPASSQRKAGLIFSSDPRKFDLQVRAKGYQQP